MKIEGDAHHRECLSTLFRVGELLGILANPNSPKWVNQEEVERALTELGAEIKTACNDYIDAVRRT